MNQTLIGDARDVLPTLPDQSVQMCVTSPPYFGLRDYGHADQIGLEPTVDDYVNELVAVFREVRRVLRNDGTIWLNLGDSYVAPRGNTAEKPGFDHKAAAGHAALNYAGTRPHCGLKTKDLIGIPWRVAFALQAGGWYLRQDIIWHKPNPMPESVRDRCTKSHEYIFLLSKSPRYYYDAEAISEPAARPGDVQTFGGTKGRGYQPAPDDPNFRNGSEQWGRTVTVAARRNRRSVWKISTKPYKGAHFAVFPPEIPELCILAGSKPGDTVLDPFGGSGTTAQVADKHERHSILIELNPCNEALIDARLAQPSLWGLRP